jgi:hypothetical protein
MQLERTRLRHYSWALFYLASSSSSTGHQGAGGAVTGARPNLFRLQENGEGPVRLRIRPPRIRPRGGAGRTAGSSTSHRLPSEGDASVEMTGIWEGADALFLLCARYVVSALRGAGSAALPRSRWRRVRLRFNNKSKVKGSGQECPLHTSRGAAGRTAGSSPGLRPRSE